MPCFIERIGSGRFRVEPCTPICLDRNAPREDAIGAAAQSIANEIAVRVRRRPEFWYQFYRYWEAQRDAYEGLD